MRLWKLFFLTTAYEKSIRNQYYISGTRQFLRAILKVLKKFYLLSLKPRLMDIHIYIL